MPICYQSAQTSAVTLMAYCVFALALLCVHAVNPPTDNYEARAAIQAFAFLVVLVLASSPSAIVVMNRALAINQEQDRHIELLNRKIMNVRVGALGFKDPVSTVHAAKRALRKRMLVQSQALPAVEVSDLESVVEDMVNHIEKFDPKPTIMGVALTPTKLSVMYGYICTAVGFAVVSVLGK